MEFGSGHLDSERKGHRDDEENEEEYEEDWHNKLPIAKLIT